MESKPIVVSISCITYNHEKYIAQCLDGFLMQTADFGIEVLIHDDASTDHTPEILREYQKRYPNIIKPIFQTENQWSRGQRGFTFKYNIPRAKGKYIALCEGDDYWTDPLKLQKQVDFLERHPRVVACGTLYNSTQNANTLVHTEETKLYNFYDVITDNRIGTLTNVFRNIGKFPDYFDHCNFGDMSLLLYLTKDGDQIAVLPFVAATYRIHGGGVYSSAGMITKIRQGFADKLLFLENNGGDFKYLLISVLLYFKRSLLFLGAGIKNLNKKHIKIATIYLKMILEISQAHFKQKK